MNINDLPLELLIVITDYLNVYEIMRLILTNKYYNVLLQYIYKRVINYSKCNNDYIGTTKSYFSGVMINENNEKFDIFPYVWKISKSLCYDSKALFLDVDHYLHIDQISLDILTGGNDIGLFIKTKNGYKSKIKFKDIASDYLKLALIDEDDYLWISGSIHMEECKVYKTSGNIYTILNKTKIKVKAIYITDENMCYIDINNLLFYNTSSFFRKLCKAKYAAINCNILWIIDMDNVVIVYKSNKDNDDNEKYEYGDRFFKFKKHSNLIANEICLYDNLTHLAVCVTPLNEIIIISDKCNKICKLPFRGHDILTTRKYIYYIDMYNKLCKYSKDENRTYGFVNIARNIFNAHRENIYVIGIVE